MLPVTPFHVGRLNSASEHRHPDDRKSRSRYGEMRCPDVTIKAGDVRAFITNHKTSLPTLREIIDEFGSLSAQRAVYNGKENATIASDLICQLERQTK